ncbi:MAG: hypothetical protein GY694_18750 [Gammaproteobacteria bacterium]|nr:hypothetical protein [Gammaproteobacteria bacterium]
MKRTSCSIKLIIPDLIDPVPYLSQLPVKELPELPVFSKMLSCGLFSETQSSNSSSLKTDHNQFYSCLIKELSEKKNADSIPIASLSLLSDLTQQHNSHESELLTADQLKNKWIMRADPCYLVADRDQLVLAKAGSFDLSMDEAKQFEDEINGFFNDFNEEQFWTLKIVSPESWYIISDKPIFIQSIPPENALGQPIKSFLFNHVVENSKPLDKSVSNEEDTLHWLNLFNEIQMILHQSGVNNKRKLEKKTPINSLWFWGGGAGIEKNSNELVKQSETLVYSDHLFVKSLCQLNQQKCHPLTEKFKLPPSTVGTEKLIYVIDDFSRAIKNKDIFTWVGLLEQFETNYLAVLFDNLKRGQISQLELLSPSGKSLVITKAFLRRWWRKKCKYHMFLNTT